MATSRKGSTTPPDLRDDSGGLVAGGGPDLSGTSVPPAKPAPRAKAKSKSVDAGPGARAAKGGGKEAGGTGSAQPAFKPGSRAAASSKASTQGPGSTSSGAAGIDESPPSAGVGAGTTAAGAGGDSRRAEPAGAKPRLSDEERQRRIAEAAYRKAQERGFAGDRQLEDWLEAEREHNEAERGSH